jgi:DNA-binding IclR family transcriptional regulator
MRKQERRWLIAPSCDDHLVKSAVRAMAVFEYFQHRGIPARANDIGEALGMAKSSTNDLLKSLAGIGYLTFDPTHKTYLPSFRFVKLGIDLGNTIFDQERLLRLMEDLRGAVGETVSLLTPEGNHMQFVGTLPGPSYTVERHVVGFKVPILGSAAGMAYLATMRDTEVLDFVKAASRALPAAQRQGQLQAVLGEVREVRRRRFAIRVDEESGTAVLATAIAFPPRHLPIVIGVRGAVVRESQAKGTLTELSDKFLRMLGNHRECQLYFDRPTTA